MFARMTARPEWQFFAILPLAHRPMALAWWGVLLLRGVLPALFGIAMGVLVGAVERGDALGVPLALVGVVFVLQQILAPVHQVLSTNLGNRTAQHLYGELTEATVRPPGMDHLEDPSLTNDLAMARDFDLGITGPPLAISMDFIAAGRVQLVVGFASAVILTGYAWWAGILLLAAWASTHWLLREAGVWKDRENEEVRDAQRYADYTYRLAVDPPAAKELRLFGLAGWTVDRFRAQRRRLFDLRYRATRMRERPTIWALLIVIGANGLVFWTMADAAIEGRLGLDRLVVYAVSAVGVSAVAFGGLSWALDDATAPVMTLNRLRPRMASAGALAPGSRDATGMPAQEVRFRNVSFAYPSSSEPVLRGLDLTIPAGTSLAIVGQNGAGKTTLAKLLCRLYDPQEGAIEVDGVDLRDLDLDSWRSRVTAVFQDFIRFELPLRDNVAPLGAPDEVVREALAEAGAANLASLDTPLAKGYPGGTDLSGGQWQRVALARALRAVREGAGLVLLDEPTAQLDVRGEAEIFNRILAATRHTTTILISHRFSTVRHADRIAVVEEGHVVELGTHAELMALGGRYHTMFELQASRFGGEAGPIEEGASLDVLS